MKTEKIQSLVEKYANKIEGANLKLFRTILKGWGQAVRDKKSIEDKIAALKKELEEKDAQIEAYKSEVKEIQEITSPAIEMIQEDLISSNTNP